MRNCDRDKTWWCGHTGNVSNICTNGTDGIGEFHVYEAGNINGLAGNFTEAAFSSSAVPTAGNSTQAAASTAGSKSVVPIAVGVGVGVGGALTLLSLLLGILLLRERRKWKGLAPEHAQDSQWIGSPHQGIVTGQSPEQNAILRDASSQESNIERWLPELT